MYFISEVISPSYAYIENQVIFLWMFEFFHLVGAEYYEVILHATEKHNFVFNVTEVCVFFSSFKTFLLGFDLIWLVKSKRGIRYLKSLSYCSLFWIIGCKISTFAIDSFFDNLIAKYWIVSWLRTYIALVSRHSIIVWILQTFFCSNLVSH